jgi:hypothetical protein
MARKKAEIPEGHVKVYVEDTAQVTATVGAQVEVVVPQEMMQDHDTLLAAVEEKYYSTKDTFTFSFDGADEQCSDYTGDIPSLESDIEIVSLCDEDGDDLQIMQA